MNYGFGLAIESLVAVLLLFTIGYCMMLNKRLKLLKADEQSLKATISELITATEIAERAIGGLKLTVRECDDNLGRQLLAGGELTVHLAKQIATGNDIMKRLAQIALAAKQLPGAAAELAVEPDARTSSAKAIAAAAQAFADRKRTHGLAA